MKVAERDELLIRLEERQIGHLRLTESQEEHLNEINGHLCDHSERLTIVETKVDERTSSKVSKKAMAGISGGVLIAISIVFYVIQAFF